MQSALGNLRLDKYMTEHGITTQSEGVTKMVEAIKRLPPQCRPQFRSGANKINFLREAVIVFKFPKA